MSTAVVFNRDIPHSVETAENVCLKLNNYGIGFECLKFDSNDYEDPDFFKNKLTGAETVIAIGGDGTIIRAAKAAALSGIPVLGINAGRLGYLASLDGNDLSGLGRLAEGRFTVEDRMMLKAEKLIGGEVADSCNCLNDAVISKRSLTVLLDIKMTVGNDNFFYRADGFIASTPTGSTAYSMSAGGPVVDPSLECTVLTPVCPHTIVSRPMVVGASLDVLFSVSSRRPADTFISSDGNPAFGLDKDSELKISVSDIKAKFIKFNEESVFKVFSQKTSFDNIQ